MPAGRPTKYDPAYHPEHAYKLALLSHTDEEMAAFFEIDVTTFYEWMKKHEEFSQSVTRGKVPADADVAVGLHKRGTGYEYASEKIVTLSDGDGGSYVERVAITVHVPPDPGAALNWLKNRQPAKWRDKKQLELEDQDGQAVSFPVVRVYSPKPEEPDAA
jgi:hypothetical protein